MIELFVVNINGLEDFKEVEGFVKEISPKRRQVIERYLFDKDKIKSLIAELLLRYILGNQYGINQEEIKFEYNQYGKPFLKSPNNNICFNLSHSGDFVACGIGTSNLGIDVEKIKKGDLSIARNVLSKEEKQLWERQDMDEKIKMFYRLWTLKESYSKYIGKGLAIPFKNLNFRQEKGEITVSVDNKIDSCCCFFLNELGNDYYIAFCTDRNQKKNVETIPSQIPLEKILQV